MLAVGGVGYKRPWWGRGGNGRMAGLRWSTSGWQRRGGGIRGGGGREWRRGGDGG